MGIPSSRVIQMHTYTHIHQPTSCSRWRMYVPYYSVRGRQRYDSRPFPPSSLGAAFLGKKSALEAGEGGTELRLACSFDFEFPLWLAVFCGTPNR